MRMRVPVVAGTLILGLAGTPPVFAGGVVDCTCRAKDVVASEGQTVCLITPSGPRLALCEKVLNNTSWRFLSEGCGLEITGLQGVSDDVVVTPDSRIGHQLDALESAATGPAH